MYLKHLAIIPAAFTEQNFFSRWSEFAMFYLMLDTCIFLDIFSVLYILLIGCMILIVVAMQYLSIWQDKFSSL